MEWEEHKQLSKQIFFIYSGLIKTLQFSNLCILALTARVGRHRRGGEILWSVESFIVLCIIAWKINRWSPFAYMYFICCWIDGWNKRGSSQRNRNENKKRTNQIYQQCVADSWDSCSHTTHETIKFSVWWAMLVLLWWYVDQSPWKVFIPFAIMIYIRWIYGKDMLNSSQFHSKQK